MQRNLLKEKGGEMDHSYRSARSSKCWLSIGSIRAVVARSGEADASQPSEDKMSSAFVHSKCVRGRTVRYTPSPPRISLPRQIIDTSPAS